MAYGQAENPALSIPTHLDAVEYPVWRAAGEGGRGQWRGRGRHQRPQVPAALALRVQGRGDARHLAEAARRIANKGLRDDDGVVGTGATSAGTWWRMPRRATAAILSAAREGTRRVKRSAGAGGFCQRSRPYAPGDDRRVVLRRAAGGPVRNPPPPWCPRRGRRRRCGSTSAPRWTAR